MESTPPPASGLEPTISHARFSGTSLPDTGVPGTPMSDAESVLDNLLDVVRSQAEEILESARAEAAAQAAEVLADAERERSDLLAGARAEASAIVEAAIAEIAAIEDYRNRLETLASRLREPAAREPSDGTVSEGSTLDGDAGTDGQPYMEVDPEAITMLAGELGVVSCRDVVDTFLAELRVQMDYLAEAAGSGDASHKKIGRVLHNLSSGCATVGAYDVAALCNEITATELAQSIDALSQRGATVYDEVTRIRDAELAGGGDDGGTSEDAS